MCLDGAATRRRYGIDRVYISYTSLYWRRKSHIHRECIIINKCSIKNAFCFFCCFCSVFSFCSDPFCAALLCSVLRFSSVHLCLFVCVWAILKLEVTRNKIIMPMPRASKAIKSSLDRTSPESSAGDSPPPSVRPNLFLMGFRAKRSPSALMAFSWKWLSWVLWLSMCVCAQRISFHGLWRLSKRLARMLSKKEMDACTKRTLFAFLCFANKKKLSGL